MFERGFKTDGEDLGRGRKEGRRRRASLLSFSAVSGFFSLWFFFSEYDKTQIVYWNELRVAFSYICYKIRMYCKVCMRMCRKVNMELWVTFSTFRLFGNEPLGFLREGKGKVSSMNKMKANKVNKSTFTYHSTWPLLLLFLPKISHVLFFTFSRVILLFLLTFSILTPF